MEQLVLTTGSSSLLSTKATSQAASISPQTDAVKVNPPMADQVNISDEARRLWQAENDRLFGTDGNGSGTIPPDPPVTTLGNGSGTIPPDPPVTTLGNGSGTIPPDPPVTTLGNGSGTIPPDPPVTTLGNGSGTIPPDPPVTTLGNGSGTIPPGPPENPPKTSNN